MHFGTKPWLRCRLFPSRRRTLPSSGNQHRRGRLQGTPIPLTISLSLIATLMSGCELLCTLATELELIHRVYVHSRQAHEWVTRTTVTTLREKWKPRPSRYVRTRGIAALLSSFSGSYLCADPFFWFLNCFSFFFFFLSFCLLLLFLLFWRSNDYFVADEAAVTASPIVLYKDPSVARPRSPPRSSSTDDDYLSDFSSTLICRFFMRRNLKNRILTGR